jgi:hypothetical protein
VRSSLCSQFGTTAASQNKGVDQPQRHRDPCLDFYHLLSLAPIQVQAIRLYRCMCHSKSRPFPTPALLLGYFPTSPVEPAKPEACLQYADRQQETKQMEQQPCGSASPTQASAFGFKETVQIWSGENMVPIPMPLKGLFFALRILFDCQSPWSGTRCTRAP